MKIQITQFELDALKERLLDLQKSKKVALNDVRQALKYGAETWHDNDMFDTAKLKQQNINSEIIEIENAIKKVQVVVVNSNEKVQIGSEVELEELSSNKKLNLKIGGDYVSKLDGNWISLKSPIGLAINNKSIGEIVEVSLPQGTKVYKINKIKAIIK